MRTQSIKQWAVVGAIVLACCGSVPADEYYAGGVTVDIDRDVLGYLWVEDATVNLYENAHIVNDAFFGDIYASSGSVINIYGGQIDGYLFVTTASNGMPEAQVTVYGTDFAVDGVPVAPGTAELFLQDQELSGVYETGTPFAHRVDCAMTADFYLTVKLGWIASEADIDVPTVEFDFGQVDIAATQSGFVTVYNTGNANLTLQALNLLQQEPAEFEIAPFQQVPVTIEPQTGLDIEILYIPAIEGIAEAVLQIISDDPDEPVVEVALTGEGLSAEMTPAEQMAMIMEYYQTCLQDGTIEGTGRGHKARYAEYIFTRTLTVAAQLIDGGYDGYALKALKIAEQQCDGEKHPHDIIVGEGTAALNMMLNDLIDTIEQSLDPQPRPQWQKRWHNRWYRQCRR